MAAAQNAQQKNADANTEAAKQEPAATQAPANAEQTEKPETQSKPGLVVTGPAVVLTVKGGGERYLYRGAPVSDGYTAESIKHASALGLVGKSK